MLLHTIYTIYIRYIHLLWSVRFHGCRWHPNHMRIITIFAQNIQVGSQRSFSTFRHHHPASPSQDLCSVFYAWVSAPEDDCSPAQTLG